jgi:hypothetical protein
MRRRAFLILAGTIVIAGPGRTFAADSAPLGVVTALYRIYAGPKGDYATGNFSDPRVEALFTRSLRSAMTAMYVRSRKDNEPILDFDPVTDSQDPQVDKLTIAADGEAGATASFSAGDSQRLVHYRLKREDGAWKVDDIAGGSGDDKWDLRDIIKPGAK